MSARLVYDQLISFEINFHSILKFGSFYSSGYTVIPFIYRFEGMLIHDSCIMSAIDLPFVNLNRLFCFIMPENFLFYEAQMIFIKLTKLVEIELRDRV